jgi:hypothetical protein
MSERGKDGRADSLPVDTKTDPSSERAGGI